MTTREILEKTKAAWPSVRSAGADDKNRLLLSMAEHLMHHADEILFANAQDVEQARGTISEVMLDRLTLTKQRIAAMAAGVRAALDDDNQKIGYKIRAAQQVDRVPYMLVLGAKEAEAGNVSVRDRKGETTTMEVDEFIAKVTSEIKNRSL